MKKIGDITSTADSHGEFTNGNPATGVPSTTIEGAWLNGVQRELVNAVEGSGLTLDLANDAQLNEAIKLNAIKNHPFNQAFCDAIGGYPKGAILLGADGITLYQNTVDANPAEPESGA